MTKETHKVYHSGRVPRFVAVVQPLAVEVFMRSWEFDLDLEALIEELAGSGGTQNSSREQ